MSKKNGPSTVRQAHGSGAGLIAAGLLGVVAINMQEVFAQVGTQVSQVFAFVGEYFLLGLLVLVLLLIGGGILSNNRKRKREEAERLAWERSQMRQVKPSHQQMFVVPPNFVQPTHPSASSGYAGTKPQVTYAQLPPDRYELL